MEDKEIELMAKMERDYWWFIGRKKIIFTLLEEILIGKSNLKILDIGCGSGGTTLSLTKFGTTFGTDFSISALKHCVKQNLMVLKSYVYNLPFPSETFDLITIFDALEHMEDDLLVLKEIKRILKKDGIIIITVPAYRFLWSDHDVVSMHYRRYTTKDLSRIVIESGLQHVRMSYMITILFPLLAIFRLITKLKKGKTSPKSDLTPLPYHINKILQNILFLESKIIKKINLPFGLSVLCIAKVNYNKDLV